MLDLGTKILIVDDAACVRTTMSNVLVGVGYCVRTAEDGFSALREIRREVPDVILSDLDMPGMSGFELLQVVRHRFPAILLIAMSGSFSGSEVPSGVAAEAFYQKGSSIGALLQIFMTPQHLRRVSPPPYRAAAPLRIQCDVNRSAGMEPVKITCPECMRTFAKALEAANNLLREMDCVHCGNPIQYTIVTNADQTSRHSSQPYAHSTMMAVNASGPGRQPKKTKMLRPDVFIR
jgi:CheY-like chemotaxis protein